MAGRIAAEVSVRGTRPSRESPLPRVSVVVPARDASATLPDLLRSLLALDWPADRLEILVVDNGSRDRTAALAESYPVAVVHESAVCCASAARNRGVAFARGDWVAFTNADCVVPRDWLRALLDPEPPGDAGAVCGPVLALETDTPVQRFTERFGLERHVVDRMRDGVPCCSGANLAVRRSLLRALGGFRQDTRHFGDLELAWRLQKVGGARLVYRPEARVLHRHGRTLRDLWRQGCRHGRGAAFMRRTFPGQYHLALRRTGRGPLPWSDRLRIPLLLGTWYLSLGSGLLMGPSRTGAARYARLD